MTDKKLGTYKEQIVSTREAIAVVSHVEKPTGLMQYERPNEEYISKSDHVTLTSPKGAKLGDFDVNENAAVSFTPLHDQTRPVSAEVAAQVKTFLASKDQTQLNALANTAQHMERDGETYAPRSAFASLVESIGKLIR